MIMIDIEQVFTFLNTLPEMSDIDYRLHIMQEFGVHPMTAQYYYHAWLVRLGTDKGGSL